LVIVLNPNDPRKMAEAERLNERLVHRPLSYQEAIQGGSASGSASNGHPTTPESQTCETFGTFVGI
jgi:hypothetical protein